MSSELYKLEKDWKIVRCEFANLTLNELMTGPYAIKFTNPDFFPMYYIGLHEDICFYFNSTGRLYMTLASLVECMKHFLCQHDREYDIEDKRWKEVLTSIAEAVKFLPQRISLATKEVRQPEQKEDKDADAFEAIVGKGK